MSGGMPSPTYMRRGASAASSQTAEQPGSSGASVPVFEFRDVTKRFGQRTALDRVSLQLRRGEILGIVGESGSGKSTCIRLALGLERPTAGEVHFEGRLYPTRRSQLRAIRRRVGVVFQDPYDALDPRMSIADIVAEPMLAHSYARRDALRLVPDLLETVGLRDAPLHSYPSRYSGGGRQRIAIARALSLDPTVLLCDEPTASLDVSVQASVVNLLLRLRAARDLSLVFVSHDLALVRRIADTVVVLQLGRVVETGPAETIWTQPTHPYTRSLLASIPGQAR